jgi:hypothetical protein
MAKGGRIEITTGERTETDDGVAMALLQAAADLAEVKERIEMLVNTHAMRRGVSIAAE